MCDNQQYDVNVESFICSIESQSGYILLLGVRWLFLLITFCFCCWIFDVDSDYANTHFSLTDSYCVFCFCRFRQLIVKTEETHCRRGASWIVCSAEESGKSENVYKCSRYNFDCKKAKPPREASFPWHRKEKSCNVNTDEQFWIRMYASEHRGSRKC